MHDRPPSLPPAGKPPRRRRCARPAATVTPPRTALFGIAALLLATGCSSFQRDVGWDRSPRVEAQDLELSLLSYAGDAQILHARLLIRNLGGRDVLLPAGSGRSAGWITASSAGHALGVSPSLASLAGDGIDDPLMRIDLPCSGALAIPAHASLLVDADVLLSGTCSPTADSWSLTLSGRWAAGGTVALTLVVPPDRDPDPRELRQTGRP